MDELLKLLFVWSIFVCSALAFLSDDLISLTLLEDRAKEQGKMKKYGVFKMIQYVVALVISGMIVAQLLTIVNTQMTTGEATTVLSSTPCGCSTPVCCFPSEGERYGVPYGHKRLRRSKKAPPIEPPQ